MMQRDNILRIIIIIPLLILLASNVAAQDQKRVKTKKQFKQFKKLQEDREEEDENAIAKGIAKHEKIQTKETRKRMKSNKKRMRRYNKDKNSKGFLSRLFTKKPR